MAQRKQLPQVGGSVLQCSLSEFEHRCRVYLMREQEKIAPDNGLIAVLCDGVRLAREYTAKRIPSKWIEFLRHELQACSECPEHPCKCGGCDLCEFGELVGWPAALEEKDADSVALAE